MLTEASGSAKGQQSLAGEGEGLCTGETAGRMYERQGEQKQVTEVMSLGSGKLKKT